ncbi:MAG: MarR family winged helix-turn-helix transcriptional regulator [Sphaerochaeta sp.]|jgi:DNA-binding MarR family transcriptional regulator|nr:MarR family winged helix-turn-helix transcriptional regulator [Sphaerochaeta sp.]
MKTLILCLLFLAIGMFIDHYVFITSFRNSVNRGVISALNGLDRFLGVKSKKAPGGLDLTKPQLSVLAAAYGDPVTAADIAARTDPKLPLPAVTTHIDSLLALKLIETKGIASNDGTPRMLYRLTSSGKKLLETTIQ